MTTNKSYVIIVCDKNENVIETRVFSDCEAYVRAYSLYEEKMDDGSCGCGACGCACDIIKLKE